MIAKLRTFLVAGLGMAAAGALIAAPQLWHFLDRGGTAATVAEISAGKLSSRNVTVRALVLADRGLREIVTKKDSQTSPRVSFYMPISDPGAPDGPTQVVVHTWSNEVFEAVEHPERPMEFRGTVRDVLWEGMSSEVEKDLGEVHPLAKGVKLLELESSGHFEDLAWGVGAPLAGLLLGLLAASTAHKQQAQG